MNYITTAEAAQVLGLDVRRVARICQLGHIEGAQKWGRDWMIPTPIKRRPVKRAGRRKAAV